MKLIYLLLLALTTQVSVTINGMSMPNNPDMRLLEAIKDRNFSLAYELIKANVDLNVQDGSGATALMKAIRDKRLIVALALIHAGADLNAQDFSGDTALITSAYSCTTIARPLINAGAKLNLQNKRGSTALMFAAQTGALELVDELIEAGAELDIQDTLGQTAVSYATTSSNAENGHILKALIAAKANLDLADNWGDTPLMWAARFNNALLAQILIYGGANLDIRNSKGYTALIIAATRDNENIAKLLINGGAKLDLRTLRALTDLPWPIDKFFTKTDERIQRVFTLITVPAPEKQLKHTNRITYNQQVHVVQSAMRELKALADNDLLVNLVDADGNRPLHAALLAQNKYMVQLILRLMLQAKRGESVMQANNNGHTPVHLAVGQSPALWLSLLGKFTGYYFLNSELA